MIATACPLCGTSDHELLFTCKDHTVTGEVFPILQCMGCQFVYTGGAPAQSNIGRYYQSSAYISHTDRKDGFVNRLYQFVRKRAVVSKRKMISRLVCKEQRRLLDYGCGTGAFLQEMQSTGWHIQGIEPDPGARNKAAAHTQVSIGEPSMLVSTKAAAVDVITLWHVLEHVHDLHETLDQFQRILDPNGFLIVAVPNHRSRDAFYYKQHWAAFDVPRHLYHFDPDSMQTLMKMHGFDVVGIRPMWFDAYYVSLLSDQYKSGKIRPVHAFMRGLVSNLGAIFQKGVCSSQIYVIRKRQPNA